MASSSSRVEELESLLESLRIELDKKSQDLNLAAEIGQSLLETNQKLGLEKEELLAERDGLLAEREMQIVNENNDAKLKSLTLTNQELLAELDQAQANNQKLQDNLRSAQEISRKAQSELERANDEICELQDKIKTVSDNNTTLVDEKNNLSKKCQDIESVLETTASQLKLASQDRDAERERSSLIEQEKALAIDSIQDFKNEIDELSSKLQETEALLESYQEYREQYEEQTTTIEQMNLELEFLRESNQKLTSRLSVLEPTMNQQQSEDTGGKTLLHEIEERRLQLINDHQQLAKKHEGLSQSHTLSLYRQQKMKHHIARLSQLTSTDASSEKIQILEESLAQCQSEKIELEKRLSDLQLSKFRPTYSQWDDVPQASSFLSDDAGATQQHLETLELRVQQLIDECESLKKMNQNLRMVKSAETDKLQSVNRTLLERDRELDQLKRELANTRFELDEMLLDRANHSSVKDCADLSLLDVKPRNSLDTLAISSTTVNPLVGVLKENVAVKSQIEIKKVSETAKTTNNVKPRIPLKGVKNIKVDRSQIEEQQCQQQ